MPFWFGAMGSHDDSSHQGSAKRDAYNGVAGLDANGKILAQGQTIYLKRDGSEDIYLAERSDSEQAVRIRRAAANDYDMYLNEAGGSYNQLLTTVNAATISNKTIDNSNSVTQKDSSFTLQNAALTTRQARFDLSNLAIGTKTLTLNDTNQTLIGMVANCQLTTLTGAQANAINYTPPAAPSIQLYRITGALIMASWTTPASFTVQVTYKDDRGTARTETLQVIRGSTGAAAAAVTAVDRWYFHLPIIAIDGSGTAITVSTTGTFTGSPSYDLAISLERIV